MLWLLGARENSSLTTQRFHDQLLMNIILHIGTQSKTLWNDIEINKKSNLLHTFVLVVDVANLLVEWIRQKLACLVDCNDDYIGIGIAIIRNARCCNVIIIPIQLFGNPIVIEPWICIPHVWYNILKRCNESFLHQIA